ncbi:MAG: phosphonate ABC transporter, permease protein PhnE [Alphaproteobacteria bacterium]|nr:phosphonate ABC transporter, permease protein PhnE [Alphaproteobacteria bacterium]
MLEARRCLPGAFCRPLAQRLLSWLCWTGLAALVLFCAVRFDMSPLRLWSGLSELGTLTRVMFPPASGGNMDLFLAGILETLAMAFLGTLIGGAIAFPLSFLAAKNILPAWLFHFGVRRVFDVLRGVDVMIWALIFVVAIGLGPLAGILAIAISDAGTLAKLFSEAIENIDRKQTEGVRSTGANAVKVMRFGVIPQVLPVMLSFTLYMFESNTRSATILGIVGAGGIGLLLADRIRANVWDQACLIIILILVTVYFIDFVSKRLRERLIGQGK